MNFGMSQEDYTESLPFQSSDFVFLQKDDNRHRIVAGCKPIRTVFYPCIREGEDGERRELTIPFIIEEDSIFDKLADVDKKLRHTLLGISLEKVSSPLQPSNRYSYLIFDRKDTKTILRVAQYPKTVHTRIFELQVEPHPDKPTYLANCLMFMHDMIIKRKEDPARKKTRGRGVFYTCDFMTGNPFEGKVPVQSLRMSGEKLWTEFEKLGVLKQIFTEEELAILIKNPNKLNEATKPITDKELMEKFNTQLFFNLTATDSNDNYLFPKEIQQQLAEGLIKLGLELNEVTATKKLQAPQEKATDTAVKEKEETKEAPKEEFTDWSNINTKTNVEGDDIPF